MNRQHVIGLLLAIVAGLGCSDSTPIGSIQCIGEQVRCEFPDERLPPDQIPSLQPPRDGVSSSDLDVLSPTFTRRAFEDLPELYFHLVADADGNLWSMRGDGSRLLLEKYDREGTELEEIAIAPPNRTHKPDRYQPIIIQPQFRSSMRSLNVVTVMWSRGCDGTGDSADCQIEEVLAFDDFAEPPRRTVLSFQSAASVQANDSGSWVLYGDRIDKYDGRGNLRWRQTGLLALERPGISWSAFGAVQTNNELKVLLQFYSTTSDNIGLELWRVDAVGNIAKRHHVAWNAVGWPAYGVDPRGRDIIVGSIYDGDLVMMRVGQDLSVDGNVIERDDYLDLSPDGFALDSDGSAYVSTRAGGREPSDMREMLCQLPVAGNVRCFTLGELSAEKSFSVLVDDLVVPEPGVVYIRTGADLRRYELPPL